MASSHSGISHLFSTKVFDMHRHGCIFDFVNKMKGSSMKAEEIKEIVELHDLWRKGNPEGVRADLRGANLREANLRGANLREANLRGADLRGADLRGADLRGADLWGANLRGANLWEADLREANLREADLREANLREADLREADLREANLREADLWGADLREADLRGADLRGADLRGADLRGADLWEADLRGANIEKVSWPSPTIVLLASWGTVSSDLCLELMRYDAFNHPDPKAFDAWAENGTCPYDDVHIERAASFTEKKGAWSPGPAKSAYALMQMLLKECCKQEDSNATDPND